ncbi:hypothetical protein BQ8482_210016 [Mesorhizobium delmotii]|uniref:Uncharacterized protein n=1 Tax=Mesorhizobium delmotii TaxID=1631247 RepID=A0A2P9AKX1_9HYPH|nr:hypothetical protein BQ8482_210016 [Mesorhizobium delmotii]
MVSDGEAGRDTVAAWGRLSYRVAPPFTGHENAEGRHTAPGLSTDLAVAATFPATATQ